MSIEHSHRAPWWQRIVSKRQGLGIASVALATAVVAQGSVVTDASWNDSEWTHGTVGTLDCDNPEGQFATQATGRALSGELLGLDLDSLVEVRGVEVINDGTSASATAGTPVDGIEDAWADPLTVEALSAVELSLDGLLELPADSSTGVVGQFAQARSTGEALGSSGYITNSGGIDLETGPEGYPDLATLELSELLNSDVLGDVGLGSVLEPVADVELTLGAVSGQASFDGCDAIWAAADEVTADAVAGLSRDYHVSDVELSFESEAVGTLVTAIGGSPDETCDDTDVSVITGLECTVNGISGNDSVLSGLTDGITGLLGDLTNGLGLGDVDLDVSVDLDTSSVRSLLSRELVDDGGVVAIDLSNGMITVDTAALLDASDAIGSGGLNGLAPNTNPLSDPEVINELNRRVAGLLGDWINEVSTSLDSALDAAIVHLAVDLDLTLAEVALEVNCEDGGTPGCTLGNLLDPSFQAPVSTDIEVLGLDLGLGRIVELLIGDLTSSLGGLLGTTVDGALSGLAELPAAVVGLTEPVVTSVTSLYSGLFGGVDPLVSLTFNAQNDPVTGSEEPQDWVDLPDGQYDVAALRLGVLDALGDEAVVLYLGRGSVGPIEQVQRFPHRQQ